MTKKRIAGGGSARPPLSVCRWCHEALEGSSGMCIRCAESRMLHCPDCTLPGSRGQMKVRVVLDKNGNHREVNCDTCCNRRYIIT